MKFLYTYYKWNLNIYCFNKAALYIAIQNSETEIAPLLLTKQNIDINASGILNSNDFIKFLHLYFV